VRLALVSSRELFPRLNVSELIDLSQAPVAFPADLEAAYDIVRAGTRFTFTPKLGTKSGPRVRGGTRALPPFTSCSTSFTGDGASLPITLSAPPVFDISLKPSLDLLYTSANGLERFVVSAEPTISVQGGVSVAVAFEGKVECTLELFTIRIPVGGPLALVIGGLVPVGVGIEASGKLTVAQLGLSTKVETKAKASIGLACPGGTNCEFVKSLGDFSLTATPTIDAPSLGDLRVDVGLAAFGFVKAAIGNPFLKSLRFEAVSAKAGGKLTGSFAPVVTQILDAAYKSDYKLSLEASAGVGADLSGALALLGLSGIASKELVISTDLATSPAGIATGAVSATIARAPTSDAVDPGRFQTGDTVTAAVKLDPASLEFLGVYNVGTVILVRNSGGQRTELGRVSASADQSEFAIPFVAKDAGSVNELFAFLVTKALPLELLQLEIGNAQSTTRSLQVSPGDRHTCAVLVDGRVKCWGKNDFGALGDGTLTDSPTPVVVVGISNAVAVAAGNDLSCAALADGTIKCWGSSSTVAPPFTVPGFTEATTVTLGQGHLCSIGKSGALRCWGNSNQGQVGAGTFAPANAGVAPQGITTALSVSAGSIHTCAVLGNGSVSCWGLNNFADLSSNVPVAVGLPGATAVGSGSIHTCARLAGGTVKCWGNNGGGQLGNGGTADSISPVDVLGITNATTVSAGRSVHSCAHLAGGMIKCWGANQFGQVGDGTSSSTNGVLTPTAVLGITNAVTVSVGGYVSCAPLTDGTLKCWGGNEVGQLGDGTKVDSSVPVTVNLLP
jgi:alpha-tubulin suppressor-like RCC1 family protein